MTLINQKFPAIIGELVICGLNVPHRVKVAIVGFFLIFISLVSNKKL